MGSAVIQSILFFVLGFLCAGLLALLVAPAIWRRAVRLTRKRVEAAVPLTLTEIQADKDRLRAEFAVSTRRLEMSVKELREKAAEQIVDIGRGREELRHLTAERDEMHRVISDLEARGGELRSELRVREEELGHLADKLVETDGILSERAGELDRMGKLYEEASLSSVNTQAELLVRAGEAEKLAGDVDMLRGARREVDKQLRDLEGELRSARDAARSEKKKAVDLEKRAERMLATIADREETILRREKDLSDLRERLKGEAAGRTDTDARLTKVLEEKLRLEAQTADLTLRLSKVPAPVDAGATEGASNKVATERRLDERLVALTRENQKLRADLATRQGAASASHGDDAQLREQMHQIAAEVIALTARLDGPGSPIDAALDAPTKDGRSVSGVLSLADRVRALKASSTST